MFDCLNIMTVALCGKQIEPNCAASQNYYAKHTKEFRIGGCLTFSVTLIVMLMVYRD